MMKVNTVMIRKLVRLPKTGDFDELNFEPGINVLVGEPNTGKTQWLRMFNYLMGDPDSNPANAFDESLSDKYDSIKGVFLISGKEIILERHWKQSGNRGKVFINGEPVVANKFSSIFLDRLNIPILHYPQGNPLSFRTWPELSWRSLLRHIYRRQTSWGELVTKQPEVDQHACILLFLGIAEYLFSSQHMTLADRQKELYKQEVLKEGFINTLNQISNELLNHENLGMCVTKNSIQLAIQNIDNEVSKLLDRRSEILEDLQNNALQNFTSVQAVEFEESTIRWEKLQLDRANISSQMNLAQSRLIELEEYGLKLENELFRIERARSAGQVFRDLRVTHCPVCEKSIDTRNRPPEHCYLCGQLTELSLNDSTASEQRLDFEMEQLRDEAQEAKELISIVHDEVSGLLLQKRTIDEELAYTQSQMKPIQMAASAILPPEISQIDMDLGRSQERKRQLERIQSALELHEDLSEKILELETDIKALKDEVEQISYDIDFEKTSSLFASSINQYLDLIKEKNPSSWTQGKVGLRLQEKTFSFTVGSKKISNLGATMMLYFLAAYNYALLSMSRQENFHYPGLSILEFPASFSDGSTKVKVQDLENFILEPFINLVNAEDMQDTQIIAVGRAFENLEKVHRVELRKVWA